MDYLVTMAIFCPVVGAMALALVPAGRVGWGRGVVLAFGAAQVLVVLYLWIAFDLESQGLQFVERHSWWPFLGAEYHVGVDGYSLAMLLLVGVSALSGSLVTPWSGRGFPALMALLNGALSGAFAAADLFLWLVFVQVALLAAAGAIWVWGGRRRGFATAQFLGFNLVANLAWAVGLFYLGGIYQEVKGGRSFALSELLTLDLVPEHQLGLLAILSIGLVIQLAVFPLHCWLPAACEATPALVAALLAAAWPALAVNGLVRLVLPLCPQAFSAVVAYALPLAAVGMLYGALLALVQRRRQRRLAYGGMACANAALLGICSLQPEGIQAGPLLAVNGNLCFAVLFFLAAIKRRRGGEGAPLLGGCWLVASLALVGMPGLSGFSGHLLLGVGIFARAPWAGLAYVAAMVLLALALLEEFRRITGPRRGTINRADLGTGELAALLPLLLAILWLGLQTRPLLEGVASTTGLALSRSAAAKDVAVPKTRQEESQE